MTYGEPTPRDLPLILHDLIDQIHRHRTAGVPQAEIDELVSEYRALRADL